jgi:hypothetical protein
MYSQTHPAQFLITNFNSGVSDDVTWPLMPEHPRG